MRELHATFWLIIVLLVVSARTLAAAELASTPRRAPVPLDYAAADPELKVELLDSSPRESFLSVRADAMGRLFVGGRETLSVYEPDDQGGYHARRPLLRFPRDSWVYDVA